MGKPVPMYHLTTVGDNNATLRSFFERQANRVGPEWIPNAGQRNGFFVSSSRSHTEDIGRSPIDDGDDELSARQKGVPMIVTVECDFSEGWDIDYEDSPQVAKMAFFRFTNDLVQTPHERIALSDGTKIRAIRAVEDNTRDGLEIDVTLPKTQISQTIYMPWDEDMDLAYINKLKTMPAGQLKQFVQEERKQPRVSEYALLQSLRDYLIETQGDVYRKHEERVVRDAIDKRERMSEEQKLKEMHALGVSMKYNAQKPLKILKYETLGARGRWTEISAAPSHDRNEPVI